MDYKEFFFKNKLNIFLVLILALAFIIRLKYFNINTAVWWDEAEYLSTAKNWVFNVPYEVSAQRQPLYPLMISLFYFFGITGLSVIKFFTVLIPSLLSVYGIYLLGKEMYDKKIGLISSFIFSVFWISLYWSSRISTDSLGLMFGVFAFYFFWNGLIKEEKQKKNLIIMGLFLGLGFLTRIGNVLPILIILIFLILIQRTKFITNKNLWLSAGIAVITIIPYLIWNLVKFGNPLAFYAGYFGGKAATIKAAMPIAWNLITLFQVYPLWFLFIFFIIGLITLFGVFIGFDIVFKNQDKKLTADFFTLIMIIIPMVFFIFIERQAEPRWALIIAPPIFFVTAKGIIYLSKYIEKFNKKSSVIFIILVLLIGAYSHISYADNLLESKKDSFSQFREAGTWIKEHSNPADAVYNNGEPQNTYYSERRTFSIGGGSPEEFEKLIKKNKIRYIVISLLEKEPDWLSVEQFGSQGLQKWSLPYFESELILEKGQARATFKDKPSNEFPPKLIEKKEFTFELVYQMSGLFIYEVKFKN